MGRLLTIVLGWFVPHLIAGFFKYLTSLGIGFISYQFVSVLINRYIQSAIAELGRADAVFASFINLSGLDTAISIIFGAMMIRGSILAMGLAVVKGGTP